jgi:hypothetical protein
MAMGLDTAAVTFLSGAKSAGVDYTRTATLGRQLFFPNVPALRRALAVLGIEQDAEAFLRENRYSERFFSLLGAQEISSIDYSPFEGATIIHDMNAPVPDGLRQRFSLVLDSGTLEHIFNICQALRNCMEMVEPGGHFIQVNAANNYMGHGFWQFSPELIFRVFSPANGFRVEAVLLHEVLPGGAWYAVADPDLVRSRVELCNSSPTYVLTVARRVEITEIFASPPQQSDYVALWGMASGSSAAPDAPPGETTPDWRMVKQLSGWRHQLPAPVKRTLKKMLERLRLIDAGPTFQRGLKRGYYRLVKEEDLLRGRWT